MTALTLRQCVSSAIVFGLMLSLTGPAEAGISGKLLSTRARAFTTFKDLKAKEPAPSGTLPGTSFNEPGVVQFLANPDFYLLDSNRSWGFVGRGSATIKLGPRVTSVVIAARGSSSSDTTGKPLGKKKLAAADGFVHALNREGKRIASEKLSRGSLRADDARFIEFGNIGEIAAIELENVADAGDSMVVIGGIGVSTTCRSDINADGTTDIDDLVRVISSFDRTDDDHADLDGDGAVDIDDLVEVLTSLGTCAG